MKKISVKPRKVPKQGRSKATVDAILDATAHILIKDGYEHASTNRIAEKAGVSIGSLYQYFPNKQALVSALNTRLGEKEMLGIQRKFQDISEVPVDLAVRELVQAFVDSHRVSPKLHKVLVEQVPRVGDAKKINEIDEEIRRMMRDYLGSKELGLSDHKIDIIVFVVMNIVETLTHQAVLHHPELLQGDTLVDEIAGIVDLYIGSKLAN